MLTVNGALLFEQFSGEEGPSNAKLFAADAAFGQGSVTCLTIGDNCDTFGGDPAWSRDGSKILFVGQGGGLFIVDTFGAHLRPVQDAEGNLVRGLTPTWVGPTGSGISFAGATTDSGNSSYDILYAPISLHDDYAEIGALKNLTPHLAGDFSPSWNPEGTSVVFDSNREGGDIYRIDDALTDHPTLTNLTADRPAFGDFKPDWSPDGTKIAFFSATPTNDIWVMNADGSGAHNVTNDIYSDDAPAWSPDGTMIVYTSAHTGFDPDIFTIHADGTGIHAVTDNDLFDWNPDWQPLPVANLNIDIRDVADPVAETDVAEYTVKVKNGGPDTATNIRVVTEPLPASVDFQSINNSDACTLGADRRVTCVLGDAEAGGSLVTPLKLRLNQRGAFTLTGRVFTDVHDPVLVNDSTSETTTVALSADVGVSIAVSAGPVTTIETFKYTLSVGNAGPSTAFDVVLTDTLPPDLDYVSVTSTLCGLDGRIVTCHFDAIDPLRFVQVDIVVAKKSTDLLTNVADVQVRGSIDNFTFNDHASLDTAVTSPLDSDGDSLFDVWETKGIDANLDGIVDLDLPAMGATPRHKDLFLEVDYMNCLVGGCADGFDFSTRPSVSALVEVVEAFANSPVQNLDGADGIDLHILLDESMRMGKDTYFQSRGPFDHDDFDDYKLGSNAPAQLGVPCGNAPWDGHFGRPEERASSNCANILEARRMSFRYSIFGVNFVEGTFTNDDGTQEYSSGVAEFGGNDLMVALGALGDEAFLAVGGSKDLATAKRNAEAGTLMHEFGHTLGLGHGGGQALNLKPNYLSLMNYDFQFPSLDPTRPLDYSRQALPDLDERSLDEATGIGGPAGRVAIFHSTSFQNGQVILGTYSSAANGPLDWDHDGFLTPNRVSADINEDEALGILRGYDDWANLIYNFRASFEYANGVRTSDADVRTIAEFVAAAESIDADGDGASNAADNCPGVANADQADANGNGVGDVCEPATSVANLRVESAGEALLTDAGPIIAVRFYVTNEGSAPATGLTVSLPAVTDATFVSALGPAGVSCAESVGTVTCSGYADLNSGKTMAGTLILRPQHTGTYAHEIRAATTAADADLADNHLAGRTVVTRSTFGLGWQNATIALDVNVDGSVAPVDALLVINELNAPAFSGAKGKLPAPPLSGVTVFIDVDGNGFCVPLDALLVINYLNAQAGSEGEGADAPRGEVPLSFSFFVGQWSEGVETSAVRTQTPVASLAVPPPERRLAELFAMPLSTVGSTAGDSANKASRKSDELPAEFVDRLLAGGWDQFTT